MVEFQRDLQKSAKFTQILRKICENFRKNLQIFKIFAIFWIILKIQPDDFVDLEKCRKMSIWLQKLVLMQPRTSLGKNAVCSRDSQALCCTGRLPDLCPVCLRKLCWLTATESAEGVRARYERLAALYGSLPRESFGGFHEWVKGRLAPKVPAGEICEACEPEVEPPTGVVFASTKVCS